MAFSPCSTLFGTAEIVRSDPIVERDVDCLYRPFSAEKFFDRDPSWGIYGLDGTLNAASAYVRGPDRALVGQSTTLPLDLSSSETDDVEHVYFGPLIPHYGHFLVTSLARAWFISRPEMRNVKILCHSDHPVAAHLETSYMGDLISALGLSNHHFTRPVVPTRFTKLTIPGSAFLEQKSAHEGYLAPMHRIGDVLLGDDRGEKTDRAIYLSKSRMGVGSVAHIDNEVEIESALQAQGIDIVHPETLSIQAQLRLFATRPKLIGFVGSAFHTHIFLRQPPNLIAVTLDHFINSNLIMLDKLNGAASSYFFPTDNIQNIEKDGFSVTRQIRDVPSFVRNLLDASELPRKDIFFMSYDGQAAGMKSSADDNCVPDHQGENYQVTLQRLHAELKPRTYLEIGTLSGATLKLSQSPSIAIDPKFQISSEVIGSKEVCLFYQFESDRFFERYDPKLLLHRSLEFCFLDGMHRCEFLLRDFMNAERHSSPGGVIALHDCLPVEIPMTDRTQCGTAPILSHRAGWWTGDVWRTVVALKEHRPDLRIICLDAAPTGLVLVANLDPTSRTLQEHHDQIVEQMMAMKLDTVTVAAFLKQVGLASTADYTEAGALTHALGVATSGDEKPNETSHTS